MITNSIKNQAMDYKSLRNLYIKQNRLNDAEAFFQKALEHYKVANPVVRKRNASKRLKCYVSTKRLPDLGKGAPMVIDTCYDFWTPDEEGGNCCQ